MSIVRICLIHRLLPALLIASLVLPVTGCGRKAQPEPPPGADFPQIYPSR